VVEGRWTLTVASTDDQGLSSSATQRFAVNSTLGFLRVTPSRLLLRAVGGKAAIRWTQTRAARVKVTVETPAGIVLQTIASSTMQPGSASVAWDGTGRNGKPLSGGRYVVRVAATNELGTVSLTQPLSIRR
jgi:flagellar hook assembly protein FlgD